MFCASLYSWIHGKWFLVVRWVGNRISMRRNFKRNTHTQNFIKFFGRLKRMKFKRRCEVSLSICPCQCYIYYWTCLVALNHSTHWKYISELSALYAVPVFREIFCMFFVRTSVDSNQVRTAIRHNTLSWY